jgi:hypothetical protein
MIDEKIEQARHYKRKVAGSFVPINGEDIISKVSGKTIYISKKIDGEFNLFWFDGIKSVLINGNGKVKEEIPVLPKLTKALQDKNIKSLTMAVELHMSEEQERSRIFEVMSAIANDPNALTLSAFDLLELDGTIFQEPDYAVMIEKISKLLEGSPISSVDLEKVSSSRQVSERFKEIVINNGAEGLVVRSLEFPIIYKIKPVHTIDAAIIGFTEGEEGKIREILLGVMHKDGRYSQIGRTGNGFTEDQKQALYDLLSKEIIPSPYIEADKRRVAFQMVVPKIVVEIAANELLVENMKGTIKNPLLSFSEKEGYSFISNINGISLQHPVFKRIRDDKSVNDHDIRFSQITDIIYLEETTDSSTGTLTESEIIFREVYTKTSKSKTNVQKFVVWKTNKEEIDHRFPAYVLHYTNFSPTRKEPLKREVRVSSSKEQILQMKDMLIEKNIKKGWALV